MRKITREAADAFVNGRNFSKQNMTVSHGSDGIQGGGVVSQMYLHGNLIAFQDGTHLRMTLAGWNTTTTRERLNGLLIVLGKGLGPGFYQKDFAPYYGEHEIESDEWIIIT